MTEEYKPHGSIRIVPGAMEIHVRRSYTQSVDRVWNALVRSDRLAEWLAPGSIEPFKGGQAKFNFVDSGIVIGSTVSEFDSPRAVAYSWSGPGEPNRPLRFETSVSGEGTILTVKLQLPSGEDAARTAAGFEAHLEMLAAALAGTPITFPFAMFKAMRAAYQAG
jgi:uncharacterized protein YndB with AHSA1/START domain